ncbi:RluA family pseudouridine synthase [Bariatricus sp. SGI.154]|uniref:RluA family pseudouridine synthase n=1 Tax=Bariatricus sp. SGI.154 TaxID=3420549 RepID=UPI003CFBDF19
MKSDTLEILYEDKHILVCVKPHGIATQSKRIGTPDMVSLLKNHIYQNSSWSTSDKGEPYLAVIHRLDQPVKGILVFAKTPFAARELNRQLQSQGFGKYYRALVDGQPPQEEDTLENYMVKDARTNTSRICTPDTSGAKIARLHYTVVKKGQGYFKKGHPDSNWGRGKLQFPLSPTELDIQLDTGRHHQIRVQLANIGCPIIGDTKYNQHCKDFSDWQEIRLCAYRLDFQHPKTHTMMHFNLQKGTGQI